ncbi:MAG: hypothetical protein K0Q73_6842 [Paenibacillus sp.]|nr:hypothetical protein [Paenibacillus sp.]
MSKIKLIQKISSIASIISLVCLLTGMTVLGAEEGHKEWRFSKPIDVQTSSRYHALFLDEDVYAGANVNLSDLRIVDNKGKFVPYYIDSGYGESMEQSTVYSSDLVTSVKKDNDTLIDFRIKPKLEDTDIQGNTLLIGLPKEAFLKHTEIYGSYDGNQWELLAKEDLFRTDQFEKNTIELGAERKFNYYRLVVLNNVENLAFPQMQLLHNMRAIKWNEYKKMRTPAYVIKEEAKQTNITIPNEQRLKIKKVLIDVGGSFIRPYAVYDPNGNAIQVDGKKELYRVDFKDVQIANTTITASAPIAEPQLTLKINNSDNPPLKITGITIEYFVDKLVFEDQGNGPYQLLYGNSKAGKPQYDIVNFKSHIQKEGVILGKLGAQAVSPEAAPQSPAPWWFQSKTWFNIVIIVVALGLILFLTKKLNRTKSE